LNILNNLNVIEDLDYDDKIKCIYIIKILKELENNV
jgi:hypothetical protein